MAMLSALCAVMRKEGIFCLHVEHGLRAEESRNDAEFVRGYCEKQGINCRVVSIPPGKIVSFARRKGVGIEAAARFFRRRALFRYAAQLGEKTRILTAHTRDDMLETALMRVLRGAGPAGLAAMPAVRGRVLRPLLSMTRADVIAYLKEKKIPWREDSTNADEKFLRNRIRRRLIPLLDEAFPSWKSGVAAMTETQSLAAGFINEEAKTRIVWEVGSGEWGVGKEARIPLPTPYSLLPTPFLFTDAENFFAQPEIIREEAAFQGIDRLLTGKKISVPVKRSVVRRFCAGNVTAADMGPARIRREGGSVLLSPARKVFCENGFSLLIKEPGLYNLKKISIDVRPFSSQDSGSGFFAGLPLAFRRSFKDDFLVSKGRKMTRRNLEKNLISAVDAHGTAAFIGSTGVLFGRDTPQEYDSKMFYFVTIKRASSRTGGTDV